MNRGEVWLANLDLTKGCEIQKTRPCLIIAPPEMAALRTVMVAPMTSKGAPAPFRVELTFQGVNGLVVLDQICALDKVRLVKKLGEVDAKVLRQTLAVLQAMFAP